MARTRTAIHDSGACGCTKGRGSTTCRTAYRPLRRSSTSTSTSTSTRVQLCRCRVCRLAKGSFLSSENIRRAASRQNPLHLRFHRLLLLPPLPPPLSRLRRWRRGAWAQCETARSTATRTAELQRPLTIKPPPPALRRRRRHHYHLHQQSQQSRLCRGGHPSSHVSSRRVRAAKPSAAPFGTASGTATEKR